MRMPCPLYPRKRTLESAFDNSAKYNCKIKEGSVADAVQVEPVSNAKFPANREKNREFCKNRGFGGVRDCK